MKSTVYYVYELRTTDNKVEYIGCSKRPKQRFRQHVFQKPTGPGIGKFLGRTDLHLEIIKEFYNRKEAGQFEGFLKRQNGFIWTEYENMKKAYSISHKTKAGSYASAKVVRTCQFCNRQIKGNAYFWHLKRSHNV